MFSRRLKFDLRPNRLAAMLELMKGAGEQIIDLTLSNPTRSGIEYPGAEIESAFATSAALPYTPDPLGLPSAREAVCAYYQERGAAVVPGDVVITASTSEAYSFLFRLLADAGDRVLVPDPGYPLFDYLLRLDSLRRSSYQVLYNHGWWYDTGSMNLDRSAKAVVVISPGNPSGNYVRQDEWALIAARCAANGSAVICDEVFHDFPHRELPVSPGMTGEAETLTLVLNGFSKTAGLPQVKMSWIVVRGPDRLKQEALRKLELISDTFLSPSTAVQAAASEIFRIAPLIRDRIQARILENLNFLRESVPGTPVDCLLSEGGWSSILRLPGTLESGDWAMRLLERERVLAHPGSFYRLEGGSYLVLSLLPQTGLFREGVSRLIDLVRREGTA